MGYSVGHTLHTLYHQVYFILLSKIYINVT